MIIVQTPTSLAILSVHNIHMQKKKLLAIYSCFYKQINNQFYIKELKECTYSNCKTNYHDNQWIENNNK